jgi:hypothetical protein
MVPSTTTQPPIPWKARPVDEVGDTQRDFVIGYINENHREFGRTLVTAYRRIGTEMAQANVGSGGSYTIPSTQWTDVSKRTNTCTRKVTIQRRRGGTSLLEHRIVTVPLDAHPIPERRSYYPPKGKTIH